MNIRFHILLVILFELVQLILSFDIFSAVGLGAASAIAGYLGRCRVMECCDDQWIGKEIDRLPFVLRSHLYGQHLSTDIISKAVLAHVKSKNPRKALTLSFHGWPGGGKNYATQWIVKHLYERGPESKYYHFFSGRIDFPQEEKVSTYQEQLRTWIYSNVSNCERSLFVFDEVDKMPYGVLDGIKPYLDYHERIRGVDFRKSIFIFLSNTGGNLITRKYLEIWSQGNKREDLTLRDFEDILRRGAFNEAGGFHKCETIEANLIDHYVPFLPLEKKHVRGCIKTEFNRHEVEPSEDMIQEILKDVTFGPEENKMFSNAGCKRLSQKVAAYLERLNWES